MPIDKDKDQATLEERVTALERAMISIFAMLDPSLDEEDEHDNRQHFDLEGNEVSLPSKGQDTEL
jgi:hypothetical protein